MPDCTFLPGQREGLEACLKDGNATAPPTDFTQDACAPAIRENDRGFDATFVVHIQHEQNASWHGTLDWVEEKTQRDFRSALELIQLIDNALEHEESAFSRTTWG